MVTLHLCTATFCAGVALEKSWRRHERFGLLIGANVLSFNKEERERSSPIARGRKALDGIYLGFPDDNEIVPLME